MQKYLHVTPFFVCTWHIGVHMTPIQNGEVAQNTLAIETVVYWRFLDIPVPPTTGLKMTKMEF